MRCDLANLAIFISFSVNGLGCSQILLYYRGFYLYERHVLFVSSTTLYLSIPQFFLYLSKNNRGNIVAYLYYFVGIRLLFYVTTLNKLYKVHCIISKPEWADCQDKSSIKKFNSRAVVRTSLVLSSVRAYACTDVMDEHPIHHSLRIYQPLRTKPLPHLANINQARNPNLLILLYHERPVFIVDFDDCGCGFFLILFSVHYVFCNVLHFGFLEIILEEINAKNLRAIALNRFIKTAGKKFRNSTVTHL